MTTGQRVRVVRTDSAYSGRIGTVMSVHDETLRIQLDGSAATIAFGTTEVEDRILSVVATARVGAHFRGDPVARPHLEVIR